MSCDITHTLRRRWIIWAALISVYGVGYFHRMAPAVMAEDLMKTFGTSGFSLGGLASVYFYVYALMQVPAGILSDTWGPRKTVTAGAIIMGIGTIVFGLAPSLPICYGGRILVGIGVSVVFVNVMRVCVEWFRPNEMGLIAGLTTTAGALGGLAAATPLAMMTDRLGWRTSFLVIGAISVLLAWINWIFVRNRPSDCNLAPLAPPVSLPPDHASFEAQRISIPAAFALVVKNRYTWSPFFGFFCFYSTLISFSGLWGIPYLTQVYGMTVQEGANYMVVLSAGLIAGCPILGHLSDRVFCRRRMPYILWAVSYTIVWSFFSVFYGGKPPKEMLYVLMFLFGFCGSGFVLTMACVKEVNPVTLSGIAMGTANTGGFIGSAILQIVMGKILDINWDATIEAGVRIYPLAAYQKAFAVCFAVTVFGILAAATIKETGCKNLF